LLAATPASVMPARNPTRGSVVDAAVAIGGNGMGDVLIELDADPAHATAESAAAVSDSVAVVNVVTRRPVLRTLFITKLSTW
jgi:BioD-like phosphotransacetylase family protein